jgi:hypothetical protein
VGSEDLRYRPPGNPPPPRWAGAPVSRPTVDLLTLTIEFIRRAHKLKLDLSPRDGFNILRHAIKHEEDEDEI